MRSRPWAGWVAVGAFTGGVIGLVYGVRTGMKSEYPVLALPLLVPIGAGSGAVLGGIGGAVAYQLYRVVRRPDGAVVEER